MDIQIRIDELREKMKMAENSLEFYAVNGGEDEAEYQRLFGRCPIGANRVPEESEYPDQHQ